MPSAEATFDNILYDTRLQRRVDRLATTMHESCVLLFQLVNLYKDGVRPEQQTRLREIVEELCVDVYDVLQERRVSRKQFVSNIKSCFQHFKQKTLELKRELHLVNRIVMDAPGPLLAGGITLLSFVWSVVAVCHELTRYPEITHVLKYVRQVSIGFIPANVFDNVLWAVSLGRYETMYSTRGVARVTANHFSVRVMLTAYLLSFLYQHGARLGIVGAGAVGTSLAFTMELAIKIAMTEQWKQVLIIVVALMSYYMGSRHIAPKVLKLIKQGADRSLRAIVGRDPVMADVINNVYSLS